MPNESAHVWISFWNPRTLPWAALGLAVGGIVGVLVEQALAHSLPAIADALGQSVLTTLTLAVPILGTRAARVRHVILAALVVLTIMFGMLMLLRWAANA